MPFLISPERRALERPSVQVDMVKFRRGVADNLASDVRGHPFKALLYSLERVRPGRIGMRKIRGPHEIVATEVFEEHRPDRIVLESRPHVAPDIFAGLHVER